MAENTHQPLEVLLLDSEQSVADEIARLGHRVHRGDLGYRTGIPALDFPPHEADVVVIDIRSPALIDIPRTRP